MHTREEIVAEAKSYIGTRYVPGGQVKGAGVDCATLLFCVYKHFGIIHDEEMEFFRGDWYLHAKSNTYLDRLMRYATKVAEGMAQPSLRSEPGNMILSKVQTHRFYNHGGIVAEWPFIIHATAEGVQMVNAQQDRMFLYREFAILDPWSKSIDR